MSTKPRILQLAGCVFLSGCASIGGSSVQVVAQASDTAYFSLSRPAVYKAGEQLVLSGRVCRRARATLLSPSGVRLEHFTAAGLLTETAHAGVGPIYGRADQACSNYSIRLSWALADGDTINACFDRGRPCSTAPTVKAAVEAPAPLLPAPIPSSPTNP